MFVGEGWGTLGGGRGLVRMVLVMDGDLSCQIVCFRNRVDLS